MARSVEVARTRLPLRQVDADEVRLPALQVDVEPGHGAQVRDDELDRLRRELEQVKLEREILEKGTAFFASPILKGSRS